MTIIPGNRQLTKELLDGNDDRRAARLEGRARLDYQRPTGKWVKRPGEDWRWVAFEEAEQEARS